MSKTLVQKCREFEFRCLLTIKYYIPEPGKPDSPLALRKRGKLGDWNKYRKLVWKITDKQPIHLLRNKEKRGWIDHHLDHVVSIWEGWNNKIPAKKIGNINNLRFIPAKENMLKGRRWLC